MRFLITGAAGFIGSGFLKNLVAQNHEIHILDAMTYAGHYRNIAPLEGRFTFVKGDICDKDLLAKLFAENEFDIVVNFAAESHVDRSIASAADFVRTNTVGVFELLEAATTAWKKKSQAKKDAFRFIQISTDEVFGSLEDTGYFTETTPYAPNSPYSASKAGGDLLARAWFHTHKLPVIITNCSNNYGPRQYPEKLIPHMINCALQEKPLPVYGNGKNVRDWIHVYDHCRGIQLAIENGKPGESYCFGGRSERKNIDVVKAICTKLDIIRPRSNGKSYADLIDFVEDRKGHDWRYAIDDSKAERELGFKREFGNFEDGLDQTINWYLENPQWMSEVLKKSQT